MNDVRAALHGNRGMATFMFAQDDLDMVLYGYARNKTAGEGQMPGHALSGLRIGELSYGEEI